MKLVLTNKILQSKAYLELLERLSELEKNRKFCNHDMDHFLAVARVALIMCREQSVEVDPDILYTAALLHDLGRVEEYTEGTAHDVAGVKIAEELLLQVGCEEAPRRMILRLIASHRSNGKGRDKLENIFYLADKRSRQCFCCKVSDECNWDEGKRNLEIRE